MDARNEIVVMTYNEKLWYGFVDAHPYIIMWGIGIAFAIIVVFLLYSFFSKKKY